MPKKNLNRPCSHCKGSGTELDPAKFGAHMRERRERADLSLRFVAEQMGITAPYLSDMELGNRSFTEEMIEKFTKAVLR